jgi:hypothetical protein
MQRLGEVDNLGDLSKYGYGFFKIKKYWNSVFIKKINNYKDLKWQQEVTEQ